MAENTAPSKDQGHKSPTIDVGEAISIKAIQDKYIPPEKSERIDRIKASEREKAAKPVVARFITNLLLWLFVIQMGFFTLAYVVSIYFDKNSADVITRSTTAILDGVKTIMPITTAFLGVAIGFYFREVKSEEEQKPQPGN